MDPRWEAWRPRGEAPEEDLHPLLAISAPVACPWRSPLRLKVGFRNGIVDKSQLTFTTPSTSGRGTPLVFQLRSGEFLM